MLVFGHRGASGYAPENTFAAFDCALELGADGAETDVRLTKDGVLVLMHDATVNRTTTGTGRIASLSWSQVEKLDAGRWYGEAYAGQRVPRVAELLDRYMGRFQLILELKTSEARQPLIELLRQRGLGDDPALRIIAFSWANVRLIARSLPRLTTGQLAFRLNDALIERVAERGAREVWPKVAALQPRLVERAHVAGLRVGTWGVRSRADVARAVGADVDAVTLDWPDWAIVHRQSSRDARAAGAETQQRTLSS